MLDYYGTPIGLPDFDSIELDIESLKLHLIDERYKKGVVGFNQHYVDLRCLESIVVINETPNHNNRVEAAVQEARSQQTDQIATGAIIGGIADSMSGDDSIVDGMVIGGLLGAATSKPNYVVKIDLTEDEVVDLILGFKGGASIALEADVSGFTKMLQLIHKLRSVKVDEIPSRAVFSLPLSQEQIITAEKTAYRNLKNRHFELPSLLLFLGIMSSVFALGYFLFYLLSSIDNMTGNNPDQDISLLSTIEGMPSYIIAGYLAILVGSYMLSKNRYNSALSNGEGVPERA